jgi:malonyl CoA-acyl carrier protein transacylase
MMSGIRAAIVGLAAHFHDRPDLTAFWSQMVEHGVTPAEAGSSALLVGRQVRSLLDAARTDAGSGAEHGPVFISAEAPGVLPDGGIPGQHLPSIMRCLTEALRALQDGAESVVAAFIGDGASACVLSPLEKARRAGKRIYAVVSEGESETGPVLSSSPRVLTAAILALHFRVRIPRLLPDAPVAATCPWIHGADAPRAVRLPHEPGLMPLAICEILPRRDEPLREPRVSSELFLLSAQQPAHLLNEVRKLEGALERSSSVELSRLARLVGRSVKREYRLALVADSHADLSAKLRSAREVLASGRHAFRIRTGVFGGCGAVPGRVAFLFPGQGSQYPGMLQQLGLRLSSVRCWFDALDTAYQRAGEPAPSLRLFGTGEHVEAALFDMEAGAQLGLVGSLAMHEILMQLGVEPDCVLGHSNGEHAALIAAGLISSNSRAELCQELCAVGRAAKRLRKPETPERMLAVSRPNPTVLDGLLDRCSSQLFLAVDNCPTQIVLGGTAAAIDIAACTLRQAGSICALLPFERAHHTPLFSDWAALLHESWKGVASGSARVPVYSAATLSRFPSGGPEVWDVMISQWCRTVHFRETIELLYSEGVRVFLEAGPDAKLSAIVTDTLRKQPHLAISASARGRDEVVQLLHLCAELYAAGVPLRMHVLDGFLYGEEAKAQVATGDMALRTAIVGEHRSTMLLAAAADNRIRQRFAVLAVAPDRPSALSRQDREAVLNWPLTGDVESNGPDGLVCIRQFDSRADEFLLDHAMGGASGSRGKVPVLAFTFTTAVAAEAAVRFDGGVLCSVSHVRAHRWLLLDNCKLTLRIRVSRIAGGSARDRVVQIHILEVHCNGEVLAFEAVAHLQSSLSVSAPRIEPVKTPPGRWTPERFYADYAFHGPTYQGMRKVLGIGGNRITAELAVNAAPGVRPEDWQFDPALLDCGGQLAALWLLENGEGRPGVFPFSLKELRVFAPAPPPGATVICRGIVERSVCGTTRASFDFLGADGRVFWHIEDLEQRIVDFPERMAECLFGKDPGALMTDSFRVTSGIYVSWLSPARASFLNQNQGIWSRVLASTLLSVQERELLPDMDPSARHQWLLGQVTARDAIRLWARAHNIGLSPHEIVIQQSNGNSVRAMIPDRSVELPNLILSVDDTCSAALAYETGVGTPRFRVIATGSVSRSDRDLRDSIWQTERDGFRLIIEAAAPAF